MFFFSWILLVPLFRWHNIGYCSTKYEVFSVIQDDGPLSSSFEQDGQYTINVILRGVRATIVEVENQ